MRLKPLCGAWQVLVLEELERLHPQTQTLLKVSLELELPPRAIVLATSNDSSALQPALRQRFQSLRLSADRRLAEAAQVHLAAIWQAEAPGEPLPERLANMGWSKGALGGEFSLRQAIDELQLELLRCEPVSV